MQPLFLDGGGRNAILPSSLIFLFRGIMNFLENRLLDIKTLYENAVLEGGDTGKAKLIRSSKVIGHIHEFVKNEFVNKGISKNKIYPGIFETKPELKFSGFLKSKSQDVSILPNEPRSEKIKENSVLIGNIDHIGKYTTEKSITVNVRSQLSSLAKNFDTLYERTFAESLNLHLRTPKIVLGELYLVPLKEYDQKFTQKKKIVFGKMLTKKYPIAFSALNNRKDTNNSDYKYERTVLLIVDFEQRQPKVIYKKDLIEYGILEKIESEKIDSNLFDPYSLVPDLLENYKRRHGFY